MARNRHALMQGAGLVLVVVGVGLGLWGYQESQALGNEVATALGGGVTDAVMIRYIAGAAALALGLLLLLRR